ncbi:MAG: uracil-DNA glycosylase family protein [Bacteroidales bacterium]|nr:uracil-DNA glycosylase family protein [Bacteroidales bacterium]
MHFLNLENINKSADGVEYHPLRPFLPEGTKVLFLGSFPPPRNRWCIDFFYPNFINDHWRIEGQVFFGDKEHFVDAAHKTFRLPEIVQFLTEKGIGFFDTATAVRRLKENASDKDLEMVEKTDLAALLSQIPYCQHIVCTGQKSFSAITEDFGVAVPAMGEHHTFSIADRTLQLWRMPSSSRAYPMKLCDKAAYYQRMMRQIGLL